MALNRPSLFLHPWGLPIEPVSCARPWSYYWVLPTNQPMVFRSGQWGDRVETGTGTSRWYKTRVPTRHHKIMAVDHDLGSSWLVRSDQWIDFERRDPHIHLLLPSSSTSVDKDLTECFWQVSLSKRLCAPWNCDEFTGISWTLWEPLQLAGAWMPSSNQLTYRSSPWSNGLWDLDLCWPSPFLESQEEQEGPCSHVVRIIFPGLLEMVATSHRTFPLVSVFPKFSYSQIIVLVWLLKNNHPELVASKTKCQHMQTPAGIKFIYGEITRNQPEISRNDHIP